MAVVNENAIELITINSDFSPTQEDRDIKLPETEPVKSHREPVAFDFKKFISTANKFLKNIEAKPIKIERKNTPIRSKEKVHKFNTLNEDGIIFRDRDREQWELHLLQGSVLNYSRIKFITSTGSNLSVLKIINPVGKKVQAIPDEDGRISRHTSYQVDFNDEIKDKAPEYNKVPSLFLDDSTLGQGKHTTAISLIGYKYSILRYVNKETLKDDLNDQFAKNFPSALVTLSKIRKVKNDINTVLLHMENSPTKDIELLTLALGWKLFEYLIFIGAVNRQNILQLAAATQLLAFKFLNQFDSAIKVKDYVSQLTKIDKKGILKSKDIIEAEMYAFVLCRFSLCIKLEYLEDQFNAFLRINELELREYLGDESYVVYIKEREESDLDES